MPGIEKVLSNRSFAIKEIAYGIRYRNKIVRRIKWY